MRFKNSPVLWLIAGALATWRITSIIQHEGIFSPLRKKIGITDLDSDPAYWMYPDNFIGRVMSCFWCGSVWSGAAVTVLILINPLLILPFAYSALAIAYRELMIEDEEVDG